MTQQELLGDANRIGHRIASAALWDGPICTWTVHTPDPAHLGAPRSCPAAAGGDIYRGSAGIAWFLAELHAVTPHPTLSRAALGGIRHALHLAESWPTDQFGFYRGRVGVAYVAIRLARLLAQPRLTAEARQTLAPLIGQESRDGGLDVIHGAAGAIPALLELHDQLADEALLEMACGLGERLFEKAQRGPTGWSWDTVGPSVARHLTGLAHGAAGIGLALLELFRATGCGAYRFAAEMAFLYERKWFDASTGHWPDFRHPELSDLTFYHPNGEIPSRPPLPRAANNGLEPWRPSFATAWCHGAPGIGLARLRAFELTGQPLYKSEAETAIASMLAASRSETSDLSLCHGVAGNCELLLQAAEVFGDPTRREQCLSYAEVTCQGQHRAHPQDPCLMLGEAGIGALLLRLASESTPSFLLRRPALQDHALPEDQGFADLAALASQEYFGKTLRSFDALGIWPIEALPRKRDDAPLTRSPVEATYTRLRRLVSQQRGRRKMMQDAFRRERTAYEMTLEPTDFAEESLRRLTRTPMEQVAWDQVLFLWSEGTELVTNLWDWDPWLRWGADGEPAGETVFAMLHRQRDRVSVRQVGPFTAAMLSGLSAPVSLRELTSSVADILSGPDLLEESSLHKKVLSEAHGLYQAGFIDIVEDASVRRASAG